MATVQSSSSTLVELTSDVTVAVEKLKELSDLIKDASNNSSSSDRKNIDGIISYLKQLDLRRQEAHELLETETIKNSIIRHKLGVFPFKLRAEIDAKTKSARDSNVTHLTELQLRVTEVTDEAVESKRRDELLKMHNALLELDCKAKSEQHSGMVKKLNNCMSEKSKMQIKLNETNQSLREAEDHIKSSREDIEVVERGMDKVMKQFTEDVLSLNKSTIIVKDKIVIQEKEREGLEQKLEPLKVEVLQNEERVDEKTIKLCRVQSAVQTVTALETELKVKLVVGAEGIKKIEKRCDTIKDEALVMRKDYQAKEEEVLSKTSQLEKVVESVLTEVKNLSTSHKGLTRDLKHVSKDADSHIKELEDIQERIADSKSTLLLQAEERTKLTLEHTRLVSCLEELNNYHEGAVRILTDEINELKYKYDREKKAKETLKVTAEALAASIEDYDKEQTEIMSQMEIKMTCDQRQGSTMSFQIKELQKMTMEEGESIENIRQQLISSREHFEEMKESFTSDIKTLEENIADFTDELSDHYESIAKLEPQSADLETKLSENSEYYETKKKELIALKSQKSDIEDRIKTIGRDLEKIHAPQEKLKMDTLRCRAYTRQELRRRDKEVAELEKQVVIGSRKLLVINGENKRIMQTAEKLSNEVERLKTLLRTSKDMESQLDSALKTYREDLVEQWKKNDSLEKLSSVKDKVILKEITSLRLESGKRHKIISSIHEQFEEELENFSDLLASTART